MTQKVYFVVASEDHKRARLRLRLFDSMMQMIRNLEQIVGAV